MPASTKKTYRPETRLVHAGTLRSQFGETSEALFLTQGYVYPSAEECEARFSGKKPGYVYSRYSNPTLTMFEQRMAALEGAEAARATATGMAAVTTALMGLVRAGDHVVAAKALFGSCRWVIEEWLPRFGVTSTLVNGTDLAAWKKAVQKNTKAFFLESPTNPTLEVIDIAAVADIAHDAGAKLVVDNVFATPLYQSPLALGADCVVYSATKHIDGQGRVLGGIILGIGKIHHGSRAPGHPPDRAVAVAVQCLGAAQGAGDAAGAGRAADRRPPARSSDALDGHKKITRLIYPGRPDHPQADVIAKQMKAGSTLCSFEVKGGKDRRLPLPQRAEADRHHQQSRRRQEPGHASDHDHASAADARAARRTRHRRRAGAFLGRARTPRRRDRGSADGAGGSRERETSIRQPATRRTPTATGRCAASAIAMPRPLAMQA